jgi:tetratricopeptide (TPR) repeat protein
MRAKLKPSIGIAIGVILVGLVIWSFPRFIGACYLNGALQHLRAALRQPPSNSDDITRAVGSFANAIEWDAANAPAVERKIVAVAHNYPAHAAEVYLGFARLHLQRDERDTAFEEYRKAVRLAPACLDDKAYADFYTIAVSRDPSSGEYHYLLARHLDRVGEPDKASEEFQWVARNASSLGLSDSWVAEAYYRLGLHSEDEGEIEMAIKNYEKALGLNGRLVDAIARLERWYRQSDEMTKAEELKDGLASLEPEYRVGEKVSEDWVLLGYDLDEEALEAGTSIEMALYWLPSAQVRIDGPDWYRAGERWIQVTTATNLAPNGGFEYDEIRGKRLPTGWPFCVYGAPVENHELVIEQRNGKETTAARLRNSDEHLKTSFCTADVPVEPRAVYLQAGWIRSENGGRGYLSCAWSVGRKRAYTYVATGVGDDSWTHYAGIARPLQGAGSCRLCLINRKSPGEVSFDDILFVELDLPDA